MARPFTLLNANGSKVQFGPMTPVSPTAPLVWVRPIIVTGTANTTVPRLYGVLAVSDGLVGLGRRRPGGARRRRRPEPGTDRAGG